MNKKKLLKLLENVPDDAKIILKRDSEGNGYSPLADVDIECIYIPENGWSGQVYDLSWSADDACMEEKEWERFKKKKKCVVLSPVN